jgi:hypothetical protein
MLETIAEPSDEAFVNSRELSVKELGASLPTEKEGEEDLSKLRRIPGRLPWTAYTIAFVEMCERFSYCGTVAVCEFVPQPGVERGVILIRRTSRELHPTAAPPWLSNRRGT